MLLLLLFSHSVGSESETPWTVAHQAPLSIGFPGKNTGVGCQLLVQGIFPTQGSNLCLPHCRRILYRWATRKPNIGPFKNPPLCIAVLSYLIFMLSVFWKKIVQMYWCLQIQMSGPNGMMYMSACVHVHSIVFDSLWPLSMGFSVKNTEWVAISFFRWSSWPRDRTCISCVSCIGKSRFFTIWAIRDVSESMF